MLVIRSYRWIPATIARASTSCTDAIGRMEMGTCEFRATPVRFVHRTASNAFRAGVLSLGILTTRLDASDGATFYTRQAQQMATQSFETWQQATKDVTADWHDRSQALSRQSDSKAKAAAKHAALQVYLKELVPAMSPSAIVSHIPSEHPVSVDTTNPDRKWTVFYAKARNSLRPHVPYKWSSNAEHGSGATITLSECHIKAIKQNFDILMWYRNELGNFAVEKHSRGAEHLRLFLDCFVADLLRSLPSKPHIDLSTGKVEADTWELDEQRFREQLIMAYRYLIAKYQSYPEYEQFGPADRELLITMMKIGFLMGVHMRPDWFDEMDVDLQTITPRTRWKKPVADAFRALQGPPPVASRSGATDSTPPTIDVPCIVIIPPPQPKAVPVVPPKADEGERIEIIVRPKSN